MGSKKTRVIAIANEKGGVGKTVTAINLGAALAQDEQSVLLVDMDPQANTTKGLGIQLDADMLSAYDIIMADESEFANQVVIETDYRGLSLIPAHSDLAGAEVELVDQVGRENRLKEKLDILDGDYDFIILDTPPSLSLLTVNVFAYAREVIVPCQTHPYAFDALAELFDTIDTIRDEINAELRVLGIVPTMYDKRTRVSQRTLEKLKKDERYRGLLFASLINVNTTIADSADVGMPVVQYRPRSSGAKDYTSFARELLTMAS
jgi:chromosome partitioning protein